MVLPIALTIALLLSTVSSFIPNNDIQSRHRNEMSMFHKSITTKSNFISTNHFFHQKLAQPYNPLIMSSSREDDILNEAADTKGKVDSETRTKLLEESIAPFRGLRLFFYAALGSGAAIGGFITLTGVLAALSGARNDVDLNTEYINLAIDFGAVLVFALLAKFDFDKKAELETSVAEKLSQKKVQSSKTKAMRARENALKNLSLSLTVSADGAKQEATVGAVQAGAKQHMIIVIGNKKSIREALLGANLLKLDFSMGNILVIPYEIGVTDADKKTRPEGGFGERPMWETQPYVAEVAGDGWDDYVNGELTDAVDQSGPEVKEQGIAIVLANDGQVIRRGVGKVPWRQMVEELEQKNAIPDREKEYGLL